MKYKPILTLSTLFLVLASCSKEANKIPKEVILNLDEISLTVDVHSEKQNEFLNSIDHIAYIDEHISEFGNESNSTPIPVSFSWNEENELSQKANKYILTISENNDLSNPLTYVTKSLSYDVYNLKINTRYFYQLTSIHSGTSFLSSIQEFTINVHAPRNLYVEGVENIRDLGGWNIGDSKIFKLGMLYRTAQFNYDNSLFDSKPTKKGKKVLLDELKIKTEIDLRRTIDFDGYDEAQSTSSSPLGSTVKYISTPMYYGKSNIFTRSENKDSIKTFFNALADESNYPIAFHCVRGTDRTGALAYALGALVGMNEDDLITDYLFSDFAKIGDPIKYSTISGNEFYVRGIANSEGTTLSEKAKNYLHNTCEIEIDVLDAIIDILTEEMAY